MTSPKITDELVEKAARAAFGKYLDLAPRVETATPRECIRRALEAALSEPVEPEIVVTDEMAAAGFKAYYGIKSGYSVEAFKDAYRAMRKLEPKQEGPSGTPYGVKDRRVTRARVDVSPAGTPIYYSGGPWHSGYWRPDRRASAWRTL